MKAERIVVEIRADTRGFRREVKRAQICVTTSFWRRMLLRLAVWRLDRDLAR